MNADLTDRVVFIFCGYRVQEHMQRATARTGWNSWLWRFARPLLFRLDAERAHESTLGLLGLWSRWFSGRLGAGDLARAPGRAVALGLRFPNPIGLAAGLD